MKLTLFGKNDRATGEQYDSLGLTTHPIRSAVKGPATVPTDNGALVIVSSWKRFGPQKKVLYHKKVLDPCCSARCRRTVRPCMK